jgi:hypothetical protein
MLSNRQINAAPLAPVVRVAVMGINATDGVLMAEQPAEKLSHHSSP